MIMKMVMILFNVYLIFILYLKQKIIINQLFDFNQLTKNIYLFFIYFLFIFYFLFNFKLFFIYSVFFQSFLLRKCYIDIYYKFYNASLYEDFDFFLSKYSFDLNRKKFKFLIVIIYIFLMCCYYNIYIYIFFMVFFSFYGFNKFNRVFDDAIFFQSNGFNIKIKKKGIQQITKYKKHLLNPEIDIIKFDFVWGKHFIYVNSQHNKMFSEGYI